MHCSMFVFDVSTLDLLSLWRPVAEYYSQSLGILPWATIKLHRDVNHSTLQSSSAINISDIIPVGPAALPFFIILRVFKISSLLISSQVPLHFHRLFHYPICSPYSADFPYTFSILPSLDHFLPTHFHFIMSWQYRDTKYVYFKYGTTEV